MTKLTLVIHQSTAGQRKTSKSDVTHQNKCLTFLPEKMITRRKKKEMEAKSQPTASDNEAIENYKTSEDKCNEMLSPWEPYIMTLQSLLVWESPQHTAILLVAVNILFWYDCLDLFYNQPVHRSFSHVHKVLFFCSNCN